MCLRFRVQVMLLLFADPPAIEPAAADQAQI